MATSLYHPDTVVRSLVHDGSGAEPAQGSETATGTCARTASHHSQSTTRRCATWHDCSRSDDVPVRQTRMVYAVNRVNGSGARRSCRDARRIGELGLQFSRGWDETIDRKKGLLRVGVGCAGVVGRRDPAGAAPVSSATPFYKTPNETMLHNQDWSPTDFEALAPTRSRSPPTSLPGTAYDYDCAYTDWGDEDKPDPARDHYRIAWRRMAANTGERTLIPAIIPPGAAHVHGVFVRWARRRPTIATWSSSQGFAGVACLLTSRSAPRRKSTISPATVRSAALSRHDHPLMPSSCSARCG